ncbi:hypothetical protein ACFLZ7_01365 [Nanoarchaeota archaeon]
MPELEERLSYIDTPTTARAFEDMILCGTYSRGSKSRKKEKNMFWELASYFSVYGSSPGYIYNALYRLFSKAPVKLAHAGMVALEGSSNRVQEVILEKLTLSERFYLCVGVDDAEGTMSHSDKSFPKVVRDYIKRGIDVVRKEAPDLVLPEAENYDGYQSELWGDFGGGTNV